MMDLYTDLSYILSRTCIFWLIAMPNSLTSGNNSTMQDLSIFNDATCNTRKRTIPKPKPMRDDPNPN